MTAIANADDGTIAAVLAAFPAAPDKSGSPGGPWVPATAIDVESVRDALQQIPADDHDTWIQVGMGLKASLPADIARSLWDAWSSTSTKFDENEQDKRWRSFQAHSGGKTIAYIYWLAKQYSPTWTSSGITRQSSTSAHVPAADDRPPGSEARSRSQLRARLRDREEILHLASTRWLIKGYLSLGAVTLLAADPNLGKSTLVNAWAHCIWKGTPWLGNRVTPGSALFVLGEDVRGASMRARAWEAEYGSPPPGHGRYIEYADRLPPLCDSSGQFELRSLIECLRHERGHAPTLVVIDTLSTVWGSESENATELGASLMSFLSVLAHEFDCTFVLVHHLNKVSPTQPRRELTLSSIRGAGSFAGGADDVLALEAGQEGKARLFGLKARNTGKAPDLHLRVHRVVLGENEDGDELASVILVPADAPTAESPEAREDAQLADAWKAAETMLERAIQVLRQLGSARTKTAIANRMTGKRGAKFAALDDALSRELIIDVGTKKSPRLVVAEDWNRGVNNTPHTPEPGTGNRSPADAGPGSVPQAAGTGSPDAGTGNHIGIGTEDDGLPEKPGRRRSHRRRGGQP